MPTEMPGPEMLQGDVQSVLAWVILSLIVLYGATVVCCIKRQNNQETKYDKLQAKTHRHSASSNRSL